MYGNRRTNEAGLRFTERRRREDDAPRLKDEIPPLEVLNVEVEETRAGAAAPDTKYVRRIVIEGAPALFVLSCSNPGCKEGGHDVTLAIMHSLRGRETHFSGDDVCHGELGTGRCGSVLRYVGTASYR